MNKIINFINIKFFLFLIILLLCNFNNAKELLIYADSISYDENENIVARGAMALATSLDPCANDEKQDVNICSQEHNLSDFSSIS